MIHLNPYFSGKNLQSRLLYFFMIDMYEAESIRDFLKDRKQIKPTHKLWPFAPFEFGRTIITVPSVTYKSIDNLTCELYDTNDSLIVGTSDSMRLNSSRGNLVDGQKLHHLRLSYDPRTDNIRVFDYLSGPTVPDKSTEPESLPTLVKSLSPT